MKCKRREGSLPDVGKREAIDLAHPRLAGVVARYALGDAIGFISPRTVGMSSDTVG